MLLDNIATLRYRSNGQRPGNTPQDSALPPDRDFALPQAMSSRDPCAETIRPEYPPDQAFYLHGKAGMIPASTWKQIERSFITDTVYSVDGVHVGMVAGWCRFLCSRPVKPLTSPGRWATPHLRTEPARHPARRRRGPQQAPCCTPHVTLQKVAGPQPACLIRPYLCCDLQGHLHS